MQGSMIVTSLAACVLAVAGVSRADLLLNVTFDNNEVSGTTVTAQTGQVGTIQQPDNVTTGASGAVGQAFSFNKGTVWFPGTPTGPSWTIAFWFNPDVGGPYVFNNQGGGQTAVLYNWGGNDGAVAIWNMSATANDAPVPTPCRPGRTWPGRMTTPPLPSRVTRTAPSCTPIPSA